MSKRIDQQLRQNRIEPRTLDNFKQQLPKIAEYRSGAPTQLLTVSTDSIFIKRICLSNPMRLYRLSLGALNYTNPGTPTAATLTVGIYVADDSPPDVVETVSTYYPRFAKYVVADATDEAYAVNYASTPMYGTDMSTVFPTTSGFTFSNAPTLLPGKEYFVVVSVAGGTGTFGFWSDSFGGYNSQAGGYEARGIGTSLLEKITPNYRARPTPAVMLTSKAGLYRSGYNL